MKFKELLQRLWNLFLSRYLFCSHLREYLNEVLVSIWLTHSFPVPLKEKIADQIMKKNGNGIPQKL